jgi:hypothetical protein
MAQKARQTRDESLVVALARGETIAEAARQSGWSPRTAWRRTDDPEFMQRVRRARADMVGRAAGGLANAAVDAVETLRGLLNSEAEAVRLAASKNILDLACRFRASEELERRIVDLEERVNEQSAAKD